MPTLHLLGTGAAVADAHRHTAMAAVTDGASTLVIDCGGDAVQRLRAAGLALDTVDALYLTHRHPDHVAGFPLFVFKLWLAGRARPLPVHGPDDALAQARRLLDAFDTTGWALPPLHWRPVPLTEGAPVLETPAWRLTAAPGKHSVPVTGLRVDSRATGGGVVYSSDTAPCPAIARLAAGADVLVHEAAGPAPGHTTPEEAARLARRAGVRRLLLTHLPAGLTDADLAPARHIFPDTALAEELGACPF